MDDDGFKTTYREAVLNEQGEVIGHRGWIKPSPLPPPGPPVMNVHWMAAPEMPKRFRRVTLVDLTNPEPITMLYESETFLSHEIGFVEEIRDGIRYRTWVARERLESMLFPAPEKVWAKHLEPTPPPELKE